MFDKLIENLDLNIVFGTIIVGTCIMGSSTNQMNKMYFDTPII